MYSGGLGQLPPVGLLQPGFHLVRRGISPGLQAAAELCQTGGPGTPSLPGAASPEPETRHWAPHPAARCRPGPAPGAQVLLGCRNTSAGIVVILQQSLSGNHPLELSRCDEMIVHTIPLSTSGLPGGGGYREKEIRVPPRIWRITVLFPAPEGPERMISFPHSWFFLLFVSSVRPLARAVKISG